MEEKKTSPGSAARDGGPAGVSGGREGSGAAGSGMGVGVLCAEALLWGLSGLG